MVAGRPLEKDESYRIVTKVGDLTNGQSAPFTEYFTAHPEKLPPKGNYLNIHSLLMSYFARNLWHRMWENIHADDEDGVLDALDLDGDGAISVEEIHAALARILLKSVTFFVIARTALTFRWRSLRAVKMTTK